MTFDGYLWGAMPLLAPYSALPDTVAQAEVLTTGLAGAYGFRRTASRQVGQVLYAGSLARVDAGRDPVAVTSPVGIAEIEGYVPSIASHLVCEVVWFSTASGAAQAECQILTTADTGTAQTDGQIDLDADRQALTRGDTELSYTLQRSYASVALASTVLDNDIVTRVRLAVYTAEDTPRAVPAWVSSVSVFWRADP